MGRIRRWHDLGRSRRVVSLAVLLACLGGVLAAANILVVVLFAPRGFEAPAAPAVDPHGFLNEALVPRPQPLLRLLVALIEANAVVLTGFFMLLLLSRLEQRRRTRLGLRSGVHEKMVFRKHTIKSLESSLAFWTYRPHIKP